MNCCLKNFYLTKSIFSQKKYTFIIGLLKLQNGVSRKEKVEDDINKNKEKKEITVKDKTVKIDNYVFDSIKKVGLTIPQFKRQSTMIFEGHCEEFDAHVHVTTKSENYLEIFNQLMKWRDKYFPDTPFS